MAASLDSLRQMPWCTLIRMPFEGSHNWIGQTLAGRYRVTEKLGGGGMGVVFKARDIRLDADVVIKSPHARMMQDAEFSDRFQSEIQAMVKLSHPHIVKVIDAGNHNGLPFAVLQYLSQGSLDDHVRCCSIHDIATWLPDVAEALDFMHSQGLVHRDIKPGNILFDTSERVYLGDFGIAKAIATGADARRLTGTGMLIGTAEYIAPELLLPSKYQDVCDGRADQYSLAVTVYEMLTGHPPFRAQSSAEVAVLLATEQAKSLHNLNAAIPETLSAVVERALEKEPKSRYENCKAFATAFVTAANGQSKLPFTEYGEKDGPLAIRSSTIPERMPTLERRQTKKESADVDAHRRKTLIEHQPGHRAVNWDWQPTQNETALSSSLRARNSLTRVQTAGLIVGVLMLFVIVYGGAVWSIADRSKQIAVNENLRQSMRTSSNDAEAVRDVPSVPPRYPKHTEPSANRTTTLQTAGQPATGEDDPVPKKLVAADGHPIPGRMISPAFNPRNPGEEQSANGLRMKMVWCPPGNFMMGSPLGEAGRLGDETQVAVTLTQGFWLGKYEVTQREWREIMNSEPWKGQKFVKEGDQFPATYVSWDDAVTFCRKLTAAERGAGRLSTDSEYALPTEAQWEYACRASTATSYVFGNHAAALDQYGWFRDNAHDIGKPHAYEVGLKRPNTWNLYDMHGNVWEWCQCWYGAYSRDAVTDPMGQVNSSVRVVRGGSWFCYARNCRSATRNRLTPDIQENDLGFRVLCSSIQ